MAMKYIYLIISFISALWLCGAHGDPILLSIGESWKTQVPSTNIRVSSATVIKARVVGSELWVSGKKPGEAWIEWGSKKQQFIVLSAPDLFSYRQLEEFLMNKKGLALSVVDGKVTMSGKILRLSDWKDLIRLSEEKNFSFQFKAQVEGELQHLMRDHYATKFRNESLPLPQVKFTPNVQLIFPKVSETQLTRITTLLKGHGLTPTFESELLTVAPSVRLQVVMAEVQKQWAENMGFDWDLQAKAQLLPRFQNLTQLMAELQALEHSGRGQVLASPNLLCRHGGQAEFLAGGEFPIKLLKVRSSEVVWKKHGVVLQFKPLVDPNRNIRIEMLTEVSLLDSSLSVEGVPALRTNRLQSQFDLREGKTIALSGLILQQLSEKREGLAELSRIPILGALFRSDEYRQRKSELIVFVTPTLIENDDPSDTVQMPEDWKNHEH